MSRDRITSFTGLMAWQKGHELVVKVLNICETLPKQDVINNQLSRAVLSITSNIAEGFGRQSLADKKHFYVMARGSAYEVQNHLIVARDTNKISKEEFKSLAQLSINALKLLHGLIRSLERSKNATS